MHLCSVTCLHLKQLFSTWKWVNLSLLLLFLHFIQKRTVEISGSGFYGLGVLPIIKSIVSKHWRTDGSKCGLTSSFRHPPLRLMKEGLWSPCADSPTLVSSASFNNNNTLTFAASLYLVLLIITGPPNGPVLFGSSASVVSCNAAGGRYGRVDGRPPPGRPCGRSGGQHCTTGQYSYIPLGWHLVNNVNHLMTAVYVCLVWLLGLCRTLKSTVHGQYVGHDCPVRYICSVSFCWRH